ncbi:hypothetical protein M011DRAFT_527312 [Sporormia fimetaria CBS 119925]|uniref:Heterokaryon incompatibility domain-containing protein n=1 Tax=Sporormia fimetaria CBS 119925 TaxID=1340428 RepID=A0A6A6V7S7_9PLEO|nr:hypothetical protein M011DRAFT_527312 [Sporormia fimetaria CBS 119925]
MANVYRNGSKDLVYLGEDDVSEALTSIKNISEEAMASDLWKNHSAILILIGACRSLTMNGTCRSSQIPESKRTTIRTWVLQEAALAKSNICYCGSLEFDLVDVTRAAHWIRYRYVFFSGGLNRRCSAAAELNDLIDLTYGYYATRSLTPDILLLLSLSRNRLVTEPLDKLYGILALYTPQDGATELNIYPDYKKNIVDAFGEAHWFSFRKSWNLDLLAHVRHGNGAHIGATAVGNGFPSWYPIWHVSNDDNDPVSLASHYHASAGRLSSAPILNPEGVPREMEVHGFKVAMVWMTNTAKWRDNWSRSDSLVSTSAMLKNVEYMVSVAGTLEIVQTSRPQGAKVTAFSALDLASTLVAGVDFRHRPVIPDLVNSYLALRVLLRVSNELQRERPLAGAFRIPPDVAELSSDEHPDAVLASHYRQEMRNACKNRTFFTTHVGFDGEACIGGLPLSDPSVMEYGCS